MMMTTKASERATRFWTFQAIETSVFLGLSLLLLAATVWWANDRLT